MPQKCTSPVKVDCPGTAPPCQGVCLFKVCANYDPVPGSTNIQNLTVTFEGSTHAPPLVGSPAELEAAVAGCGSNFNFGQGTVEFVDANGNTHTLNETDVINGLGAAQGGLTPAQRTEFERILAKGHCRNWTQAEIDWMIANTAPTSLNGWDITWECQEHEGGFGLSVTELEAAGGGAIQSFTLEYTIDVSCSCDGNENTSTVTVDLAGP